MRQQFKKEQQVFYVVRYLEKETIDRVIPLRVIPFFYNELDEKGKRVATILYIPGQSPERFSGEYSIRFDSWKPNPEIQRIYPALLIWGKGEKLEEVA